MTRRTSNFFSGLTTINLGNKERNWDDIPVQEEEL